jgi:hypothetical protein
MLYGTLGKLRGDIVYTNYLIKLKKRSFGVEVFDVLIEEGGKVGSKTKSLFKEVKAAITELEAKNNHTRAELASLALTGECETLQKKK